MSKVEYQRQLRLSSSPTTKHEQQIAQSPQIQTTLAALCKLWGITLIKNKIRIEFSHRMTRSLGRTLPKKKVIRLNVELNNRLRKHLEEVLCHELAHIAAAHKYGDDIRPHGEEWAYLVRQAGYEPAIRLAVPLKEQSPSTPKKYQHQCLVCFSSRIAKKRMTRWRCASCVEQGLPGHLHIEEIP